ncbi:uncharacterized protein LOC127706055 [Mytilus californianus]|uniref:uncharacterized protein LOC127706055 n=1 Tax=Mytilus californianus TaxID=6549 RepID=UPI002247D6B0|nr:uncharacterized protein LOC127706055 [Mytilus californianus]
MVLAIIGLVGSWRKSTALLIINSVLSTLLHVPRIISIVLFVVFIEQIDDHMKDQLGIQQNGYYYNLNQNEITRRWNDMILILQCCGVHSSSDTTDRSNRYAYMFCCENAHESRMDTGSSYSTYSPNLNYFGYCGELNSNTCSGKILFKARMFVGWFLVIVFLQIILEIVGIVFGNREYSLIRDLDTADSKNSVDPNNESHSKTIIFRIVFRGIKSVFTSNWKRSKISLLHLIFIGILLVCNIGTLVLAINIRYDSLFGNSDIQALLSKFRIADHTFTRALNIFSIVVVTFSSTSIAVIIFSIISIVSPKWKKVLLFISVGLWSMIVVAGIVEIGLWGKYMASVDSDLEDKMRTELSSYYSYMYSHASGHYHRETSLSWNTLFVKAECCGVGTYMPDSFTSSYWYIQKPDPSQSIPVQCCKSQTEVYPYSSLYEEDCTNNLLDGYYYSQGCDTVIENRLDSYSIPYLVFMTLNILAEIGIIATTIYNAVMITKDENTIHVLVTSGEENVKENEATVNFKKETAPDKLEKKERKEGREKQKSKKKSSRSDKVKIIDSSVQDNQTDVDIKDTLELQSAKSTEVGSEIRENSVLQNKESKENENLEENVSDDTKETEVDAPVPNSNTENTNKAMADDSHTQGPITDLASEDIENL